MRSFSDRIAKLGARAATRSSTARPWAALAAACLALLSAPAFAADGPPLSSCGDVYVKGGAQCTVRPPSAECTAQCTPLNVEASCAADLRASCTGGCNVNIDASCTASCSGSCEADCKVDPGAFDCSAKCQASCSGSCDATCAAKPNDAHCKASCKATCAGSCNVDCKVAPPSADCKAKCDASCKGSCHAKANANCEIDCQAKGYVDCDARVTGGCKAACTTDKGALFCDGQFVDTNNLDQCVAALEGLLKIDVQGYAQGNAGCDGGTCTATAEAGANCSVRPFAKSSGAGLFGLSLLGLATVLRRRRR